MPSHVAQRFQCLMLGAAAAACVLAAGCVTVVPLQPASALDAKAWQMDVQASMTPWCAVGGTPLACYLLPDGNLPSPELRVGVRNGVGRGMDWGASLRAAWHPESGLELGPYLQVKKELLSAPLGEGRRNVLSLGLGAGFTAIPLLRDLIGSSDDSLHQLDLALPVFFGHQRQSVEWVLRAHFAERWTWGYIPGDSRPLRVEFLGLAAGVSARGSGLAVQIGYDAPFSMLSKGTFVVTGGYHFDL